MYQCSAYGSSLKNLGLDHIIIPVEFPAIGLYLHVTVRNSSLFFSVLSEPTVCPGKKGIVGLISISPFSVPLAYMCALEIATFIEFLFK